MHASGLGFLFLASSPFWPLCSAPSSPFPLGAPTIRLCYFWFIPPLHFPWAPFLLGPHVPFCRVCLVAPSPPAWHCLVKREGIGTTWGGSGSMGRASIALQKSRTVHAKAYVSILGDLPSEYSMNFPKQLGCKGSSIFLLKGRSVDCRPPNRWRGARGPSSWAQLVGPDRRPSSSAQLVGPHSSFLFFRPLFLL